MSKDDKKALVVAVREQLLKSLQLRKHKEPTAATFPQANPQSVIPGTDLMNLQSGCNLRWKKCGPIYLSNFGEKCNKLLQIKFMLGTFGKYS
jgi:hypothetical protein